MTLEILLTVDGLADKLLTALERLREREEQLTSLAEMYAWLLDRLGRGLLEKNIHEELQLFEQENGRRERFGRRGGGGFEIRADGKGGLTAR